VIFFFLLSIIFLAALLYEIFWQTSGIEEVEIGSRSIKIHRKLFGWIRTKEFNAELIRNLGISSKDEDPGFSFLRRNAGIVFTYESQIVHFGPESDNSEGEESRIVEMILARFPQYGDDTPAG
jgi:hypothetical protein